MLSRSLLFSVPALGALAMGCSLSPKEDPSQFYVLASPAGEQPTSTSALVLGLGPITIPEYLKRPQMVTRATEHQVTLSEVHRWAEDLEAGFSRVLKEELQRATGARQVRIFPWPITRKVQYVVEVDVTRFEGGPGGSVSLWAIWRVLDGSTREVLVRRESRLADQASGTMTDDVVLAQSRIIGALSREIAGALQGIE